jgi:hypothetical protein
MSTQGFVLNLLQIYKKMCGFKNLFLEISRLHSFLYASAMLPHANDMVKKDANAQWGLKLLSRHHVAESSEEDMQVERPTAMLQII